MSVRIIIGDSRSELARLASDSVHCVVTSPPYWGLRDYDVAGQIGLEESPEEFVGELVSLFREVRRVLRPDGTLWLNLGDSYSGSGRGGNPAPESSGLQGSQESQQKFRGLQPKPARSSIEIGRTSRDAAVTNLGRRATRGSQLPAGYHEAAIEAGALGRAWVPPPSGLKQKDLVGSPWMVAFALRADGWYLRQDIIWAKPNPMPESVTDRCTKAHEYLFLLSKTERYFYDADAIAEAASLNTHARGNVGARDNGDRKLAEAGSGTKNNHSFDAAMSVMPERRNKRSVWNVATQPFPEAHFATFPPALIEPCVKAGTSERGCCVRCGAPWRRVTVNVDTGKNHKMPDGMATYAGSHSAIHRDGREKGAADNPVFARQTIGWYPACDHDLLPALPPYPAKPSRAALGDEAAYKAAMRAWGGACRAIDDARRELCERAGPIATMPAVVLDPFGGAGTTGLVADRLRRDAVLIELNPQYAAMARRRIDGDAPLFARSAE